MITRGPMPRYGMDCDWMLHGGANSATTGLVLGMTVVGGLHSGHIGPVLIAVLIGVQAAAASRRTGYA